MLALFALSYYVPSLLTATLGWFGCVSGDCGDWFEGVDYVALCVTRRKWGEMSALIKTRMISSSSYLSDIALP
uniref:Putative secreted protein n=1 Tax=Anopheles marajoara TaxID=58244 RepID=A0A2M4CDM3_9DIPT